MVECLHESAMPYRWVHLFFVFLLSRKPSVTFTWLLGTRLLRYGNTRCSIEDSVTAMAVQLSYRHHIVCFLPRRTAANEDSRKLSKIWEQKLASQRAATTLVAQQQGRPGFGNKFINYWWNKEHFIEKETFSLAGNYMKFVLILLYSPVYWTTVPVFCWCLGFSQMLITCPDISFLPFEQSNFLVFTKPTQCSILPSKRTWFFNYLLTLIMWCPYPISYSSWQNL